MNLTFEEDHPKGLPLGVLLVFGVCPFVTSMSHNFYYFTIEVGAKHAFSPVEDSVNKIGWIT